MAISWKDLKDLEIKNYHDYKNDKKTSFTWEEITRLLYCTRAYKELMKEQKQQKNKKGK